MNLSTVTVQILSVGKRFLAYLTNSFVRLGGHFLINFLIQVSRLK